jgi:spore germination cell wall hydrolase CwlJ-like protein
VTNYPIQSSERTIKFSISNYDQKDKEALARMLVGEMEGYSDFLKVCVAYSAINRLPDPRWPNKLSKVILQPKQYSCFNKDNVNCKKVWNPAKYAPKDWRDITKKISRYLATKDPTHGANHYDNITDGVPNWARGKKPTLIVREKGKVIGFYKI